MNNNMNEQNNQGINNTFSNNGMNTFANNMNQPNNQAFMNNSFNNQNNQTMNGVPSNNNGGQFNNNASNPSTSEFLYNNSAVTNNMNQPNNQTFMNNNFNNKKKNLKLLIGIGILIIVVIISVVLVANLNNKKDKNNDSSLNTPTNNNSSGTTNNNSNDKVGDDSSDMIPLNTYENIFKNVVDMKVNNINVIDKFSFAISTTYKNNGNKDEILTLESMDKSKEQIAYYQGYFIPKNADVNNFSDEDLILLSCYLRKIVRNGEEINTSGKEIILKAGETLDGIIYCSVSSTHGYAAGVNPLLLVTQSGNDLNDYKYFDIRN